MSKRVNEIVVKDALLSWEKAGQGADFQHQEYMFVVLAPSLASFLASFVPACTPF